MTNERQTPPSKSPSVFLSYARQDRPTAQLLALRLQDAGVQVWWDGLLSPGENWTHTLESQLRSSDYIIALISKAALASEFVQHELLSAKALQEYSDRSITVIPILLDEVELPPSLRDILALDLRANPREAVDALVSRFRSSLNIDFSDLSPSKFESLVEDLLIDMNLVIDKNTQIHGRNFDFRFHYYNVDPFGALVDETWYIDVSHYSKGRLSVSTIREFIFLTQHIDLPTSRFALITSSQITSAARATIDMASVRVIEGVELKRLLMPRPALVEKYFGNRRP